jgi:Outer membrane protein beta-barrel family/CarboxypepD_reg-like domain/TonB-dependent Receptor Plug Domain
VVYRIGPSIFFLIAFSTVSYAVTIKGTVKDSRTKKELIAAEVFLKEKNLLTTTDQDGEFRFKNIPEGNYTLIIKYLGYDSAVEQIDTRMMQAEKKEDDEEPEIEITIFLNQSVTILKGTEVNGIVNKESESGSRKTEKDADNVMNVISAKTIELSPDITAANVLQRISGVSLERTNEGEGRYVILRGMDQRYNNTLINGSKIPSPDAYNRYVPLDLVPSELLQRIEVTKSLTPDMEGDAIGGSVNIDFKDAPDTTLLNANIFTGYSQIFFDRNFLYFDQSTVNREDPAEVHGLNYEAQPDDFTRANLVFTPKTSLPYASAGLTFGKRFFQHKLGLIVSATFQNLYTGADNTLYGTSIDQNNQPFVNGVNVRSYSTQQIRSGLNAKLDFNLNEKNQLTFTNIYLNLQSVESRHSTDTSFTTFRTGPGTGQVSILNRSEYSIQGIETATLQGKHQILNNLILNWTELYSIATNKAPDQAEESSDLFINSAHESSAQYFDGVSRYWQHNKDRDYSGEAAFTYTISIFNHFVEWKAGGLYRTKSRSNYRNDYTLRPVPDSITGGKPIYTGIETARWTVYNNLGTPVYGVNNYMAHEQVGAAFIQAKTTFGKLQILAGLRTEHTHQFYTTYGENSATVTYTDLLPNLQLRYALNDIQNLRFAIYKSIARPSYFDLVPYYITGENYDEQGNPYLKHTQATNIDLRYEIYPTNRDEILAGIFYKNILDPIETAFKTDTSNKNLLYNQILQPSNFGTAINYGFELSVIKYFGVFGINANYTFTNSSISSTKVLNDVANSTTEFVLQKRPLQGQSRNIANVSLLYNNSRIGLNVQLAYQLTGKRIAELSQFYGLDYYQDNLNLLDLSFDKNIGNHFNLFAKINNLLNSPYEVHIGNGLLVEKNFSGITYLAGLKYTL